MNMEPITVDNNKIEKESKLDVPVGTELSTSFSQSQHLNT